MLVLLSVLVLAGARAAVSPQPHTTQPRCSPPCLPALPTSRLTLHTVSRSLGLLQFPRENRILFEKLTNKILCKTFNCTIFAV